MVEQVLTLNNDNSNESLDFVFMSQIFLANPVFMWCMFETTGSPNALSLNANMLEEFAVLSLLALLMHQKQ